MTKRKRRKFTNAFKQETVRLVLEGGKTVGEVARDLNLTESAVRGWVKQAEIDKGAPGSQLVPMIDEVKETLGDVADVTVADGGYLSGEQLAAAEEKGFEVTVALGKHAPEQCGSASRRQFHVRR